MSFPARYRIAATATPKRADGMDEVMRYSFAQVTLSPGEDDMPAPKVIVKKYYTTKKISFGNRKMSMMVYKSLLTSRLATDVRRNTFVAGAVNSLYKKGRKILVVSDRLEQLDLLRDYLVSSYKIPSGRVGMYIGGVSDQKRVQIAKQCDVILATYQSVDMATDIPELDSLVMAVPRGAVTQIVGRIRRILEGKKQPVVVDILDVDYQAFMRLFSTRMKDYTHMHAEVLFIG
jgi:superfamily II DNA or RNA helicase